ncbi:MAG: 1-(5-phosphoribosyl)-5-[(5-phosphoribosylamino)methylideneamino]imidazole-4-carboxamide isomerase [Dethiobacter sp.]|nr:MAG: 1-(5-phosphoribosyl)-5-[(5-phosphoribosylamino)methylideneamino]imidazole-4-carboxamide isomerase [Dethiobacter sp.]
MQVIPAIDLHGGKCVRLLRGERKKETVYSLNPVEVALKWQSQGARRLHVVDLDGAFAGKPVNSSVIAQIASSLGIPVQLGGGIRDMATVKNALNLGVSRVILGTAAVEKPDLVKKLAALYGERIIVGIDAREGVVAVRGWVEGSGKKAVDLALEMQQFGVKEIIYTDISRDGTLEGPNMEALSTMARALKIPLIASGGVSSLQDLHALKELKQLGVRGVIVGQALYTGRFTLKDAIMEYEE